MTPASDHRPCKINIPVCSPMLYSDAGGATEEIATEADESCQVHSETELLTDKLQHELNSARRGITVLERKVLCFENLSDQEFQQYTNISKQSFLVLLKNLVVFKPYNYWRGFEVVSINDENHLLICLMKLKLDLPLYDLAKRYSVSRTTIQNIYMTFIPPS